MRRAQSLRHHARATSLVTSDDLGVLKEQQEESVEDSLRRQLLEKDRELDKMKERNITLQEQLSLRPTLEEFKKLVAEKQEIERLFATGNRHNEKLMADYQRIKKRHDLLERELARIVGDDWQTILNVAPCVDTSFLSYAESTMIGGADASSMFDVTSSPSALSTARHGPVMHTPVHPSYNASNGPPNRFMSSSPSPNSTSKSSPVTPVNINTIPTRALHGHGHTPMNSTTNLAFTLQQRDLATTTLAHIAEVRALVVGLEEKMNSKEQRLVEEVKRAEENSARLEEVKRELEETID